MKLQKIVLFTVAWTLVVVVLGAYVRLNDAGLSCPDWPGCYGKLIVPEGEEAIQAQQLYPNVPLEHGKAWLEMLHRYLASFLGLLILAICYISFRQRSNLPKGALTMSIVLVPLVMFQGALGMWTVTQLLNPAIVTAHLGGGSIILLLLWILYQRLSAQGMQRTVQLNGTGWLPTVALLALIAVYAQMLLGGWTSANYSALVCDSFPGCNQEYALPPSQAFASVFNIQGAGVDVAAAIHMTHRIGAAIVSLILVLLAWACWRFSDVRIKGMTMLGILGLHVLVAIANVFFSWPVFMATLHNALAAVLLLSVAAVFMHLAQMQVEVSRQ